MMADHLSSLLIRQKQLIEFASNLDQRLNKDDYEISFFEKLAEKISKSTFNVFNSLCGQLDQYLKYHSVLVGFQLSKADIVVWRAISQHSRWNNISKNTKNTLFHFHRWFRLCYNSSIVNQNYVDEEKTITYKDEGSFSVKNISSDLVGKVVTRFPPEPSGYLHVGHAKAALINMYYAQQYQGKLILRFDDTNPTKENIEYVDSIRKDLDTLKFKNDVISYTSDYFEILLKYAEQMIRDGKAYVDNTPVDKMREERMNGIDSACRAQTLEENLSKWAEMIQGTETGRQCVLRAKIDMKHINKSMRDPAIYRCNSQPHHRTGSKYKVYPIYDFACPIVDSLEGVTHAMRSAEYFDRNQQYQWMIDALHLRPVEVMLFSRLNLMFTTVSKRKLKWFVDNHHVDGWDDPRFPTIQGLVRRGLTIEALHQFIKLQGFSTAENYMDWTKIWGINKRFIDPISPRYQAVSKENSVVFNILNYDQTMKDAKTTDIEVPIHPKNPEMGTRKIKTSSSLYLESEDVKSMHVNEEITLLHWGNAIIRSINNENDGTISVTGELYLEGSVKKTDKKVNWVNVHDQIKVMILEYDHLLNKPILEENDDFTQYLNSPTKFETIVFADSCIKELNRGSIIQFERRGYFIIDQPYQPNNSDNHLITLIMIPDGRSKAHSCLSSKLSYRYSAND